MKARRLDEVIAAMPPERQARIRERARQLASEYATLAELRKSLGLTQQALAERLGVKQTTVARLEIRTDALISSVAEQVRAMGGQLHLIVEMPDGRRVELKGLGDLIETPADAILQEGS